MVGDAPMEVLQGGAEGHEFAPVVSKKAREIYTSEFRGNGKVSADGTRGPNASRARIPYATRRDRGFKRRVNEPGYTPPEEQWVGDQAALIMTAFHSVLQPLLLQRCEINPKTGYHLRSVTNTQRFVGDNVKFCTKCFRTTLGGEPGCDTWFLVHQVKKVITVMLREAGRGVHGRWQWRGFSMEEWEREQYAFEILRTYIAGTGPGLEGRERDQYLGEVLRPYRASTGPGQQ